MKILTVVGARPQFIKAAPLSRALRQSGYTEFLVHTGQHYDHAMSEVFFDELQMAPPDLNLEVGSGSQGWQTGQMLAAVENTIQQQAPDCVLVYGDTNSTLAGALAACKLHIPIAHVEAGLRSFNRSMPEEHNRVLTDHCSDLLLCPTQTAVDNLTNEGIRSGVHLVGDVMMDSLLFASQQAKSRSKILSQLGFSENSYLLATVHRAENTDNIERLSNILSAFNNLVEPVVLPLHPRTRKALELLDYIPAPHVRLIDPVGYLDMVQLEQAARIILTDSGGVQKEAYWLGVPCITLRNETEWVETVKAKWNILVGAESERIVDAVQFFVPPPHRPKLYGDGATAERCVKLLQDA